MGGGCEAREGCSLLEQPLRDVYEGRERRVAFHFEHEDFEFEEKGKEEQAPLVVGTLRLVRRLRIQCF